MKKGMVFLFLTGLSAGLTIQGAAHPERSEEIANLAIENMDRELGGLYTTIHEVQTLVPDSEDILRRIHQTRFILKSPTAVSLGIPNAPKIQVLTTVAENLHEFERMYGRTNIPYFGHWVQLSQLLEPSMNIIVRAIADLQGTPTRPIEPVIEPTPVLEPMQVEPIPVHVEPAPVPTPAPAPVADKAAEGERIKRINRLIEHDAASSFDILGVTPDTPISEINNIYRKIALRWHPDRTGGDDTVFKILTNAHTRIVKDKDARCYEIGLFNKTDRPQ